MRSLALIAVAACGSPTASTAPVSNVAAQRASAIALAIVYNGQELWVGNDDYETDPDVTTRGALRGLELAIDKLDMPPGSAIAAIAYGTDATIVMPWTPAAQVHGAKLGTQDDYRNKIGNDLVVGITLALDALAKRSEPHKLLVVLGDGNDINDEAARTELVDRKLRADDLGVATRAIIWRTAVSAPSEVIDRFAAIQTATTDAELGAALQTAIKAQ
jgi:hypothetical protein